MSSGLRRQTRCFQRLGFSQTEDKFPTGGVMVMLFRLLLVVMV
jgi:hypothetical protein